MPGEPVEYTVVIQKDGRVACGTVTGPDGTDVKGFRQNHFSRFDQSHQVGDWMKTVDGVVLSPPLIEEYEDDIFDDTLYINDEDYFSN